MAQAPGAGRAARLWCERGELNPQGLAAHWILSPARLPVSPLSRDVRRTDDPAYPGRPGVARQVAGTGLDAASETGVERFPFAKGQESSHGACRRRRA